MELQQQDQQQQLSPDKDNNYIELFRRDDVQFLDIPKQTIFELVKNWKSISFGGEGCEEERADNAHKDGGKYCADEKLVKAIRSVGKYVIQQIGNKILSGDFNLTKISFPIRCSISQSALQKAATSTCFFPIYLQRAAIEPNKVERVKLIITATLANFFINCTFFKPLNPILGETFEGFYNDGMHIYLEQISHHPPISYILAYGPDQAYTFYGYYIYEASAGLNSLTLINNGKRCIKFKDGQLIEYNFGKEIYSGTLYSTMKIESKGVIIFNDKQNQIVATVKLNGVKKKPTDYFNGEITHKGVKVSSIYGSYMGFVEFDQMRYWDFRMNYPHQIFINNSPLESDHTKRIDLQLLKNCKFVEAQQAKEKLEQLQRNDEELRKKSLKLLQNKKSE